MVNGVESQDSKAARKIANVLRRSGPMTMGALVAKCGRFDKDSADVARSFRERIAALVTAGALARSYEADGTPTYALAGV